MRRQESGLGGAHLQPVDRRRPLLRWHLGHLPPRRRLSVRPPEEGTAAQLCLGGGDLRGGG